MNTEKAISIPASITMTELANRIRAVYSKHVTSKSTSADIRREIIEKIIEPLSARTPSGRPKHSLYLKGYAQGIIDGLREDIMRNHVEFCYLVGGKLYSTLREKDTKRQTIRKFYKAGKGHLLSDAHSGLYWKGSDKPYFIADQQNQEPKQ